MYSGALPAVLNAGALRRGVPWDDQADVFHSLSADWRLFSSVEKLFATFSAMYPQGKLKSKSFLNFKISKV